MNTKSQPLYYYYELWFDDNDSSVAIAKDEDLHGVDRWLVYKGTQVEAWPNNVAFYIEDGSLQDCLFCTLHGWVLISDKARMALVNCSVENTQFLPIRVFRKKLSVEVGPYWVLNITHVVEALDWKRTAWLQPEKVGNNQYPVLNIKSVALSTFQIAGAEIFRLKIGDVARGIYISPKVKGCLEKAGAAEGFRFIPTPVY